VSGGSPDGVSVTRRNCNVVVALRDTRRLVVFSHTGQTLNEINLPASLVSPRHALQLDDDDQYLLCHGWGDSAYGLCVVDAGGRIMRSAAARSKSFAPTHLAMDCRGNVLVAEFSGSTVQLYNSQLDYVSDVVPTESGAVVKQPFRLCLDDLSGRLYVSEYTAGGRLLVFSK